MGNTHIKTLPEGQDMQIQRLLEELHGRLNMKSSIYCKPMRCKAIFGCDGSRHDAMRSDPVSVHETQ